LLLRTADSLRKPNLRPVKLDGVIDVICDAHTRFLVDQRIPVNKETCLAPNNQTGNGAGGMTIAQNLIRLRKAVRLSQVELAERSKVSQQLISQIERGLNTSTKYLPALASALGCRVGDLDESYVEANGLTDAEAMLISKFRRVPADKMAALQALIDLVAGQAGPSEQ
jgi:transcriptional regulator with XRE-family HTH domain